MYAEFTAALSSIKSISDLVTLIQKAKVDSAVAQKAIELQGAIISLQTAMMGIQAQNQELISEASKLKQQIADMENWETEARKYKLIQLVTDSFVYALEDDQLANQPYHWLCVHCYQNKQKSVLQRSDTRAGGWILICPQCKNEIFGPVGINKPTQDE
jgi:hypothetical protein